MFLFSCQRLSTVAFLASELFVLFPKHIIPPFRAWATGASRIVAVLNWFLSLWFHSLKAFQLSVKVFLAFL